ncbi:MAG: hypothetical protein AAF557_25435 [Pseudomonadota bacterium]
MRWIALLSIASLVACANAQKPAPSDKPECAKPEKAPIDGGLGGTGNQPDVPCKDE